MKGNITCITNPDEHVIGFIEFLQLPNQKNLFLNLFLICIELTPLECNTAANKASDPLEKNPLGMINLPIPFNIQVVQLYYGPKNMFGLHYLYINTTNKLIFWPN